MKIILTTGHPFSGYEQIEQLLLKAGLTQALPSRREGLLPDKIQGKIAAAYNVRLLSGTAIEQLAPGKAWQELAVDLFLANQNGNVWGWADPQTASLLDFWLSFDPQVRFVLVYSPPEYTVGRMLAETREPKKELDAAISSWVAVNSQLLKFYNRHQERCLLVNAKAANSDPFAFISKLTNSFETANLFLTDQIHPPAEKDSALTSLLARALVESNDDAHLLYLELESSSDITLNPDQNKETSAVDAWNDYIQLIAGFNAENSKNSKIIEDLTSKHDAVSRRLSQQLMESEEKNKENELLLLQLHQVQEELEQIFIKNQNLEKTGEAQLKQINEYKQQIEQFSKTRDEQAKRVTELQQKFDQLKVDKASVEKKLSDCQASVKHIKEQHALELKAAKENYALEASKQKNISDELSNENELLLLQLHQVQEELEHYFILYNEKNTMQVSSGQNDKELQSNKLEPLEQFELDLRKDLSGTNWYYAESDGRWAGPDKVSILEIPALAEGRYMIKLDIVDAMSPEILQELKATFNGEILRFDKPGIFARLFKRKPRFPITLVSQIELPKTERPVANQLKLEFIKLISPSEKGSDDQRNLSIRMRKVTITPIV